MRATPTQATTTCPLQTGRGEAPSTLPGSGSRPLPRYARDAYGPRPGAGQRDRHIGCQRPGRGTAYHGGSHDTHAPERQALTTPTPAHGQWILLLLLLLLRTDILAEQSTYTRAHAHSTTEHGADAGSNQQPPPSLDRRQKRTPTGERGGKFIRCPVCTFRRKEGQSKEHPEDGGERTEEKNRHRKNSVLMRGLY